MRINPWLETAILGALGGGISGSIAALNDPAKYRFPQDLGTGKMWPYFLSGAGMTIGALLLKRPFGQKETLSAPAEPAAAAPAEDSKPHE